MTFAEGGEGSRHPKEGAIVLIGVNSVAVTGQGVQENPIHAMVICTLLPWGAQFAIVQIWHTENRQTAARADIM